MRFLFVFLFSAVAFAQGPMAQRSAPSCGGEPRDADRVTETLKQMYVAATNDDMTLFRSVAAKDFYAFDGGRRLNGDELMELVRTVHKAGKKYVWTVTEPDVHLRCNDAWIAYTNRGSIQDESGTKNVTWLESAFLHKEAGVWKIQFFHSTRIP